MEWNELNTQRYYEYINNIIQTRGQWGINEEEYFEGHHIIPRSYSGEGDTKSQHDNIIRLYPNEHYIAHKILAEDNQQNEKLVYAFSMMAFPKGKTNREPLTPEEYEGARKLCCGLNRTFTEEHRQHLSEALTGKKIGPHSENRKQKISESNKHAHNISDAGMEILRNNSRNYINSLTEEEYKVHSEKLSQHVSGSKWYNNGMKDIRVKGPCPEGFVPGRLKQDYNKTLKTKNYHWYTNGINNIVSDKCPEGYHLGRTTAQKNYAIQLVNLSKMRLKKPLFFLFILWYNNSVK